MYIHRPANRAWLNIPDIHRSWFFLPGKYALIAFGMLFGVVGLLA